MPRAPRITPEDRRAARRAPSTRRYSRPARPLGDASPRTCRGPSAAALPPAALGGHRAGVGRAGGRGDAAVVRPRPAAARGSAGRGPPPEPHAGGPLRACLRHLRRPGRRTAAPDGPAALSAGSRGGGGGPAVLAPSRHRPDRPGPCRLDQRHGRTRRAGRLDHHPAGRQEPVPDQRAHLPPQGAGTAADALAGAHVHQAGNPRDLAEPGLSGLRRLGRRRGRTDVFRRVGPPGDAVAGRGARGAAACAVALQPARGSGRRRGPCAARC